MIVTIAGILLTIILILCFFNIRWGTALYLCYSFLVPLSDITLGPINLGQNFVKMVLILSLLYDFKIRHHYKLSWKLMIPFILYYAIELAIIPFQSETPSSWMYNTWRVSIMSTLFGAFVIYNVLSKYPDSLKLIRYAILVSILIAGVYGLFLTTTNGFNPYINLIVLSKGTALEAESLMGYFSAEGGRLFGRISSVFMHPMNFGLFIGLAFFYVFSIRKNIRKWVMILLMSILTLDALFCGVRSCIGGLVVAVAFYLLMSRNIKVGVLTLVLGLIVYNIVLKMPGLSDYLSSITDINNTQGNVSGSSVEMRLDQLNGCLVEIRNNPILGKGYGWDGWYKSNFGDHPVILSFESLIFVILCDNGFLGFVIWGILIYMVVRNNKKFHLIDTAIANSLLVFYIAYSCITGEYGYMQYFLIFYICLVFENIGTKTSKRLKNVSKISKL